MTPLLLGALLAPSAHAGDLSVGFGLAASKDFNDAVSDGHTTFGVGPTLLIPIKYAFADTARLRATVRSDLETGNDRISWVYPIDGNDIRYYDDAQKAYLFGMGITVGADVDLTHGDGFRPYLGAELGVAMVNTYHSQMTEASRRVLLDPAEFSGGGNPVNPYTSQGAFLTDFHIGGRIPLSEGLALWVEPGYTLAFLGASDLKKTSPDLQARREAYGWNAARLGAGVSIGF